MRRPGRCLAILLLAGAAASICPWVEAPWVRECYAQGAGSVRGLVMDDAGKPLAGALVNVTQGGGGVAARGAVTNVSGLFEVVSLPPAPDYKVTVSFPGYATTVMSDVDVRPGTTTTLRLMLQKETSLVQRVEVKAEPQVVQLEETTTETRFSAEFIESLPLLGRNYQDILALAPGVSDVDGDGNPNIHGARDTDMVTLVDGVSTTDPLTGKLGAQLNIESIQEIEVKTSGATAEFGRAQGGFANIVTKSGGNQFQGTFKAFWRGSLLDGDGAGIDDPALHGAVGERGLRDLRFNDVLPFLSLSGPLVKDRAWYYLANEYVQTEEPVNALGSAFVAGVKELREFLKLTWQAGPNHRLALSVNYDPQEYLNQGLNSLTREESGFTTRQGGPIVTLKATSILTPLVALETSVSSFDERPSRAPTLNPDTNHNGILAVDWNGNGVIEASERDPGEDYDADGRFDVFERDANGNGQLEPLEDADGDHRLTPPGACEGRLREDIDCDGHLDSVNEDRNHNGILDPGEDQDGDGNLDLGTEDRNGNGVLDDTPVPPGLYPYGELHPVPGDREYTIDGNTRVVSGPYYQDYSDRRRRLTFRQDLSVHLPDFHGSHDLKGGLVYEQEDFGRLTTARAIDSPVAVDRRLGPSRLRVLLPLQTSLESGANGDTTGLYVQDSYRPLPNLSLGLGARFDRELLRTSGYTSFDPVSERADFDKLIALSRGERGLDELTQGNGDGILSLGLLSDPIFAGGGSNQPIVAEILDGLNRAAFGRLTRSHEDVSFVSDALAPLFPEVLEGGEVSTRVLLQHGFQLQRPQDFAITNNNLSPRLSVSWDPWSDGRTKVFCTWGRYYDKLFMSTVIGEQGPDYSSRYYFQDPAGFTVVPDHQVGENISKAPPSVTQIDRNLATPFSDELTLGFEREIAPEVALSLTYINRRFRRQLQDVDLNHSIRIDPETGLPTDNFGAIPPKGRMTGSGAGGRVGGGLVQVPDGRPDLYIENFFLNQVLRIANLNEARYHGIELTVRRRLSRRWELQGSYTYSRAVGSAEDFQSRLGNDPSTTAAEFGYLDYDQRHVVKLVGGTYLPHDWQLGVVGIWGSGLPYSIVQRFFALDNVQYSQFRTIFGVTEPVGNGFEFEPLRRNSFRNHASYNLDVRARRAFVLGRVLGAFSIEVQNLLNTDDLTIHTYEPARSSRLDPTDPLAGTPLQIDGHRRFGRRFQIGVQFEF
jgi:outer membrane receptor protein involved in Fe transport